MKRFTEKFTLKRSTHFKNEFKKPKQMNLICGTTGLKVIEALTSELLQEEENNSKVIPNLKEQWLEVKQKGPSL